MITVRAAIPAAVLLAATLAAGVPAAGQEADGAAAGGEINPFSGFETHYLRNGVKVWFKRLANAPNVSVSAGVPVGSDADPPGKEQLAHFTEHMLFSDHDGRTEQEIKDAVESLGGRRNGFTYRDHTWYYVTIAREHGLFAIEWLAGILEPHAMEPEVVGRGRQPILNEIRARPRELFDHLFAALNPAWLTPPGFWEREFGVERRHNPIPYYWNSLNRITARDLRDFYDRYYAPGVMTVTIVGDLDRDQALAVAERTFGTIPARPVDRWELEIADPGRGRAAYSWDFRATVQYEARHKLYNPSAEELLTALFVRDLLSRRLNQRLRFGERKAVYGVGVGLSTRGPAAYLGVSSRIDRDDYDFATDVIDEEIGLLRRGALDPARFEEDRAAVVERLRGANQTAESLNFWTAGVFYDPGTFADFPDVLSFYQGVTPDEVATFATRLFDPSRQVLTVTRIHPFRQAGGLAIAALLMWVTLRILARALTRPIRIREIRYIARFRLPAPLRAAYALGATVAVVVLVRLAMAAYEHVAGRWIEGIDHFGAQAVPNAAMIVLVLVASSLIVASAPRRVLLFPDHLRIKSRAWRSRVLEPHDIAEISVRRFRDVWLSREIFRGPPLAFGLVRFGIYIRPHRGRSYFFRSRDTEELAEVLMDWWAGEVE